ncbi:unnamed protein product [Strongylus vulgaris]|uniref:Dynein heavy chain AAA lid domain-containing protein n=1 Tax=Strongylus vulgaris TaxID=40348 RepID=A0A3P7JCA7_STRVU|nr:unnamed protein product [Strongylus vulgaris]
MTTEEERKFPAVMLQRSLKVTFEPPPEADWEFIRGLLMFVIYGGRIENVFDSQVLESYLITFFNAEKVTGRSGQLLAKGIELPALASIQLPNPKESPDPIAEVVSLEFIHAIKLVSF